MLLRSSTVWKVFHKKLYGETPPLTVKSAAPFDAPLQVTLVPEIEVTSGVGSVIINDWVSVQPFASVTVTL